MHGPTRFERVPFDTAEAPSAGALLKIFRRNGKVLAQVVRYEWFEPDGHEYTGYADVTETNPRPAVDVLAEFKNRGGNVALEADNLWDPAWGELRDSTS